MLNDTEKKWGRVLSPFRGHIQIPEVLNCTEKEEGPCIKRVVNLSLPFCANYGTVESGGGLEVKIPSHALCRVHKAEKVIISCTFWHALSWNI